MNPRTVLISGASIAGLTTAHWLHRHGFAVTVVERADGLRPGGQAVDVRGAAVEVAARMGIVERVREHATGFRGMTMVDADGAELFRSEEVTFTGGEIAGDDIEIMRDDLNQIIHSTLDGVAFVFGDSISALADSGDGVRVDFDNAASRDFDLVIGADGLRSRTRKIAFGPHETYLRPMGGHIGIFSLPNYLGLDRWQIIQNLPDTTAVLYSARDPRQARAIIGFRDDDMVAVDAATAMDLLDRHFAAVGWEIPNLLRHMRNADDFYFTSAAQIHMDSWHAGRVGLVGDAGYCGSPLTGQGSSMALVGGYVLAAELAASDDPEAGLRSYETALRPFVDANQALAELNAAANGQPDPEILTKAANAIELRDLAS